ncbi:Transposon Ty3-I Gag-Pol polyprotein [Dictyocoela muelleri]|nr:Transposon Ty3-I Gag-Pol polyprotein [Dictyocoela muelleri]
MVKDRLNLYNLKINNEKSIYVESKVDFIGYQISENKIEPLTKRSECILRYNKPTTKKQLIRFLGLLNYDRTNILNLSSKLKSLYKMIKPKSFKLIWTENTENLFEEVNRQWLN